MVEVTKKGSRMLVESIDRINTTSLVLEEKQAHTQKNYARKITRVFQNTRPRNQPHTRMDVMQALNNINVPIESNCKRKCMQSSDGHDPLDTWPIPQPIAISRASLAVASRSTFA